MAELLFYRFLDIIFIFLSIDTMVSSTRRQWLQQTFLASSGVLLGNLITPSPCEASFNSALPFNEETLQLQSNENPYGCTPKVYDAVTEAYQQFNRYPMARTATLRRDIAERFDLKANNILLTAGSTEALCLIGQHVALQKGEILTSESSFPTLPMFGEDCGATVRKIPINKNQRIDLDQLSRTISPKTKIIYICNPNNPTGTEVNPNDLKDFCRNVPKNVLVCVDEAYIEFSILGEEKSSVVPLVRSLPNLIVTRTFSKAYGLAGMRIGYAIAQKVLLDKLQRRVPGRGLHIGLATIVAADAALSDRPFMQDCLRKNEDARTYFCNKLDEWGISYAPSSTNFVLIKSNKLTYNVRKSLREEHNIQITQWRDMRQELRISIGKMEEMRHFVGVLETYLL